MKTMKLFLSKKHKAHQYVWAKECKHVSWMIGIMWFFQMSQNSTYLAQVGGNIIGGKKRASFLSICITYYQIWRQKYYDLRICNLGGNWQPLPNRREYG